MGRDVTEPCEHGEREVQREHFVREALADEAREFLLVVKRVNAADHAAGAVAKHEHRHARLARFREPDHRADVTLTQSDGLSMKKRSPSDLPRPRRSAA